jgi:hypothetical protein
MRCKKCHRELTDQTSKERGYGPICYAKREQDSLEQIELNFNPLFLPGLSMIEKHEIVNRVLGLK